MTSAEEPVQAVEENDQTISAQRLPEQAKRLAMPLFPTVSFTSLIYQWQPMGFRVRVDIPFISDDSGFLFVVRNGPYIPPWDYVSYGTSTPHGVPFIYHWNNTRPVFHHRDGGNFGLPGGRQPPDIIKGITITQHDLPPIIATLAASFRKWRGDMQYRFRVVAGFATQGYLITMPIKNSHIPVGIYDEYSGCPPLLRLDTSYREGMSNSYVPSDTSMFRHTEITMPYEYPMPWYDQYHWLEQRTEVSPALMEGIKGTKLIVEPCGDNFIGLGFRGAIESQKDKSFIMIELEYRCMEGFQFADPGAPPFSMLDTTRARRYNTWDSSYEWTRIKVIPSDVWQSDGIKTVTKRGSRQSLSSRLAQLVNPSTAAPILDHGSQPKIPTPTPIYSECKYDPRSNTTYCKDMKGEWKHWPGDKRGEVSKFVLVKRKSRDTDSLEDPDSPESSRDRDFVY